MAPIVKTDSLATILGGGALAPGALEAALARAPVLVAADGGLAPALAAGHVPAAVIGDFDSAPPDMRARVPAERCHHLAEQDTTDFDKCLRSVESPLILGLGVTGARIDHELAALNTLVRHPHKRCVLVGTHDIAFLAPPDLRLAVGAGTRVSLFPLAPVRGASTGLRWPLDGIDFAPAGAIGTSNVAAADEVALRLDAPAMLVLLPPECLDAVIAPLTAAGPAWA